MTRIATSLSIIDFQHPIFAQVHLENFSNLHVGKEHLNSRLSLTGEWEFCAITNSWILIESFNRRELISEVVTMQ